MFPRRRGNAAWRTCMLCRAFENTISLKRSRSSAVYGSAYLPIQNSREVQCYPHPWTTERRNSHQSHLLDNSRFATLASAEHQRLDSTSVSPTVSELFSLPLEVEERSIPTPYTHGTREIQGDTHASSARARFSSSSITLFCCCPREVSASIDWPQPISIKI